MPSRVPARPSSSSRASAFLGKAPAVESAQLAAMRGYDATPGLGRLAAIPTLVVSAGHDPIAPPALGRALAAGIPGARYVLLPDAAHGVPLLAADTINELLLTHLAAADLDGTMSRRG